MRQVLLSLNGVSSIGIYGMRGVGKTTLAEHIHNHLLKDSRFSGNVYWVTVSQDFSITKLQSEIAKALKLDSTEDDDKKRAAILYQSLERKINFVLILDDVWTHFDVKKAGIPLDIGGAKKMTKKCDGLPLGLITMAASMRGVNDVFEWRDAFEEFKESCMQMETMNDKVFPILCYSYNRLRDPRLQKCFLYCCLYPEDFEIERDELIQRFIVEGLLDRRNSRRAEFDQGNAVLNKLERACLLESVVNRNEKKKCLKMHDLVREMALQIARDEFKWMVKVGAQLHEVPWEQEWSEDLDKVALMNNDLKEVSLPLSHVLPRLTTLLLRGNRSLNQVVEPFFAQMPGLRVLDLSYTDIEKLPSSVSNLVSLSALLLRGCLKLRFVPPLNKLKNLIELDLYGTIIEEVPQGLENLVSLRSLDMRRDGYAGLRSLDMRRDETTWTQAPVMTPAVDILARLSNLQSLSVPFVVRVEDLQGIYYFYYILIF
ncbi:putative disease resistance protein At4g10780 [Nicotiana tabacum]|uniref:Disease resistance protein At4g10780 n=1 Tax=Nicotiana tabacum TaxID=4097 RepID=A0AC58UIC9_TOBAC